MLDRFKRAGHTDVATPFYCEKSKTLRSPHFRN